MIGFSAKLVAGVSSGWDDNRAIKKYEEKALAKQIWADLMYDGGRAAGRRRIAGRRSGYGVTRLRPQSAAHGRSTPSRSRAPGQPGQALGGAPLGSATRQMAALCVTF